MNLMKHVAEAIIEWPEVLEHIRHLVNALHNKTWRKDIKHLLKKTQTWIRAP